LSSAMGVQVSEAKIQFALPEEACKLSRARQF